eukprot:363324-Chlamydomonas_euryale.AAC.14
MPDEKGPYVPENGEVWIHTFAMRSEPARSTSVRVDTRMAPASAPASPMAISSPRARDSTTYMCGVQQVWDAAGMKP